MSDKLIVPALSNRRHWMGDKERQADEQIEKEFRALAEEYISSVLPSDWWSFLKLKIEDGSAFLCDGSGWGTGRVFRRVQARNEFTLSADHIEKIEQYVQKTKAEKARKDAADKLQARLEKLVSEIEDKYETKDRRLSVSRTGLEIREDGCEVAIWRTGEISEVRFWGPSNRRITITDLREHIAEYEPKVSALSRLAEQIKTELPAEFWKPNSKGQ